MKNVGCHLHLILLQTQGRDRPGGLGHSPAGHADPGIASDLGDRIKCLRGGCEMRWRWGQQGRQEGTGAF